MLLKELLLRSFRNYQEARFEFHPKANSIVGGNAQGKTNLIEALYFLSCGRSFRTPHLSHLIQETAPAFYIEAHFEQDGVNQTLKLGFDGSKRTLIHNQTELNTLAELFGLFPVIVYAPDDIRLLTDAPAKRRRFLDMHIAQYDPIYLMHLVRYHRAMKQRNYLLKAQTQTTIENWEEQMALSAEVIIHARKQALQALLPLLQNNVRMLSNNYDHITLDYCASHKSEEKGWKEAFAAHRPKEMRIGSTLIGPHKDDIDIFLNDKEAKSFSSEGQKRTVACALRLSEWQQLKNQVGTAPLICVDDFGMHLDEKRQAILAKELNHFGQLFLTSPQSILTTEEHSLFHIERGCSVHVTKKGLP